MFSPLRGAWRLTLGGSHETPGFVKLLLPPQQSWGVSRFWLGDMYLHGWGVGQNHSEAVRWWTLAADQGDAWIQEELATLHYELGSYEEARGGPYRLDS